MASPIEGLPDVEESHCISAQQLDCQYVFLANERAAPATIVTLDEWFCPRYTDPEVVPHSSELLPGISEQPVVGGLRSAGPFLLP